MIEYFSFVEYRSSTKHFLSFSATINLSLFYLCFYTKAAIFLFLTLKSLLSPRNSRGNVSCFHRVIEKRFFRAFHQSAFMFLKGYYINNYYV